ncbi:MAG: hypothetical protein WDO16_18550 [Bacteroidota bacterium]
MEKLADLRYTEGYPTGKVQAGWQAKRTSSIEASVSGDMFLSSQTELIGMPFATCFLFTCTKVRGQDYRLAWISSLS